ncbi:MAG TPA: FecR domain-containing protein [Elusimicrobiales bacterium]|nr:FecR domain-containing protein [Elusimicrobiales bacterium]
MKTNGNRGKGQLPLLAALLLSFCCADCCGLTVFSEVQGKVFYRADAAHNWVKAQPGLSLKEGGKVKVGELSWAELRCKEDFLIGLGPDSDFILYAAEPEDTFLELSAGFLKAVVKKAGKKWAVRTPVATLAVRGTRFTALVGKNGNTKVRVFSGTVAVLDAKKRETLVHLDETAVADRGGAGPAEREPAAALAGAWTMAPPRGYRERAKNNWELRSEEAAGFSYRGRQVVLEHTESLYADTRSVIPKEGKDWPAQCPGTVLPQEQRRSMMEGLTVYSYACPAASLAQTTWQDRYYEIPVEDKDGAAVSALRLHYTHHVQAKLPPKPELRKLYGDSSPDGYVMEFQGDVMPLVAARTGRHKIDGPGLPAVIEAVLTLYQERWGGKNADEYSGKVVPMIE